MKRFSRSTFVIVLAVALAFAPMTGAAAYEDPRFETNTPEPTLVPGATQTLSVQVVNDAEDYEDTAEVARDANLTLRSVDGIDVKTGKQFVGPLRNEERRTFSFRVDVAANVASGAHELPLEIGYRHDNEWKTKTVDVEVRVDDRARFEVTGSESDTQIGATGPVSLTVRNTGNEAVSDATVSLASQAPSVRFGSAGSATRFVGSWAPGEERTVTFDASVGPDAEQREYALSATVAYEDSDGAPGQSTSLSLGVTPRAEQSFSVSDVGSDIRVGAEGNVTATVTNDGPDAVRNLAINLRTNNPNLHPLETEFAVGSLAAGESVDLSYPVEVSSAGSAGPRQVSFVGSYETADDAEAGQTDSLTGQVSVAPARDVFDVTAVNNSFAAGSGGQLELEVTNNADHAVSDVNAQLFVSSPLSTSDDEAFIADLGPGETKQIVFSVSASGSATAKDYPVSTDFQYTEPDGDTKLSDSYQLAVGVTESESGGTPTGLILGAVALVIVLLGGVWYWRRG